MKLEDKARTKNQIVPFGAGGSRTAGLETISFHQLVTLIEMQHDEAPRVGSMDDPAREFMRFRATRSLSFGPRDISVVNSLDEGNQLEIRVNFFGLYGPASPMPPHFTERIIQEDQTPSAVEDLLDLFDHRLISLLHVAWRKYRYYLRYETGATDPLSKRFLALCGFPIEDRDSIGEISRAALLPHIGLMSLYSGSADVVATIVSNFFDVPCRIEEFVPRRVTIDPESRLELGRSNNRLGEDAVLGFTIEDDLGKFRVCLGRASYETLAPFLPHGALHRQLAGLLAMSNREPLEWDISFDFEPETIPVARLGESRLGWSTWLQAGDSGDLDDPIIIAAVDDDMLAREEEPVADSEDQAPGDEHSYGVNA